MHLRLETHVWLKPPALDSLFLPFVDVQQALPDVQQPTPTTYRSIYSSSSPFRSLALHHPLPAGYVCEVQGYVTGSKTSSAGTSRAQAAGSRLTTLLIRSHN